MVVSPGMSVATSASRIFSPSVDLARLIASADHDQAHELPRGVVVEVLARLFLEHGVDLADHRPLGGEIEREAAARDHAFELVADRVIQRLLGEAGVLRHDGIGLVAEFGHGLDQQNAVGGVARRHQHVGVRCLELLHFRRQGRRVGAVLDVGHHLVAALLGQLELGISGIGAEDGVFVEQRQRLDLGALLLHGIEEIEHRGGEHLVMRSRAEIEFEAAAMQARRGIVRRDERDLVPLADLADRHRHRALIGADDGADLFLRDQALGLGAALLRIGLVIGEYQADLGAAETGQALALGQRQIEIVILVDDVSCGLERLLRIDADLCAGAGQRIKHADHHFGSLRAGRDRQQCGGGGGSKQYIAARDRHCKSSVDRRLSMKRQNAAVKPQ